MFKKSSAVSSCQYGHAPAASVSFQAQLTVDTSFTDTTSLVTGPGRGCSGTRTDVTQQTGKPTFVLTDLQTQVIALNQTCLPGLLPTNFAEALSSQSAYRR